MKIRECRFIRTNEKHFENGNSAIEFSCDQCGQKEKYFHLAIKNQQFQSRCKYRELYPEYYEHMKRVLE